MFLFQNLFTATPRPHNKDFDRKQTTGSYGFPRKQTAPPGCHVRLKRKRPRSLLTCLEHIHCQSQLFGGASRLLFLILNLCVTAPQTIFSATWKGQLGYFEFEECEGVNPVLGVKLGESYTFVQQDPSNWFHAMGFAYGADGALDDQPELEPGVASPSSSTGCVDDISCPRPRYLLDGVFLGDDTTDDFGLDAYEPQFFFPILEWMDRGVFSIELTFNDTDVGQDFFYFCHIHQFMSGRIKVLDVNGEPLDTSDLPAIPYEYDTPGEFDRACNTFGLDSWQLPNDFCPERYVCGADEAPTAEHTQFAECIEAMNCNMLAGMTTNIGMNEIALFNYHMIPHHENAINMAKALLPKVPCDDLTNEDDANCVMQVLVREIINTQNFQIQTMRGINDALGAPETDNCDVLIASSGAMGRFW